MSDTPQTNTLYERLIEFSNEEEAVDAICEFRDLCAKFERELAAAKSAQGIHALAIVRGFRDDRDKWKASAEDLAQIMAAWKNRCDEIDAGYPKAVDEAIAKFNRIKSARP